jgi:hypothetical protein
MKEGSGCLRLDQIQDLTEINPRSDGISECLGNNQATGLGDIVQRVMLLCPMASPRSRPPHFFPDVSVPIDAARSDSIKISERVDYHWESWLRPDK